MRARHYIRYADDFVIMSTERLWLEEILGKIRNFLYDKLALELHPDKISIRTLASGIDFLGWVHFPDHSVLRTVTKRRMFKKLEAKRGEPQVVRSYLGLLKHANTLTLRDRVEKYIR